MSILYITPSTANNVLPKQRLQSSEDSPIISPQQIQSFGSDRIKRDLSNFSSTTTNDKEEGEDSNAPPTVLVHFLRLISFTGKEFSRIPDFGKGEVFSVVESDFPVKLKCQAELHPYFWPDNSTNIKLNVSWVDSKNHLLSQTELLVLDRFDNQSDYRCIANIPSLEKIVAGRLLSRAVKFKAQNVQTITVEPTFSNISIGGYGRFICTVSNKNGSERIIWLKDGSKLEENKRIRIFTTDRESILHILDATPTDDGSYTCELEETNKFFNSIATLNVAELDSSEGKHKSVVVTPLSTIYAKEGLDTIVECLFPTAAVNTAWYKIDGEKDGVITKSFLKRDTAFVFHNASPENQGDYVCETTDESGIHYQNKFKLEVYDDASVDYEEEYFNNVTKKQGTPFKLLCSIYAELDESPDMATWYKDGKRLQPLPRHKITKVTQGMAPGLVLLISIVEASDEGIYQCVVRKGNSERLQQTALAVEVTTNETLTNFIVVIDHVKACFNLFFDVPKSVDPNYARVATYFLVYYNSNNASSLNSVPLSSASCFNNRTCTMSCCSPNFSFKHATDYTLQISMVLSEEGSVITPLSAPVHVTSWDASATKGLDMDVLYMEQNQELLIKWQGPPPGSIEGQIQKLVLELLNATRRSTLHLSMLPKIPINLSKEDSIYVLTNITQPFAYRMRIIPITRAGFPPSFALESMENFGFILFTSSEDEIGTANSDLLAPTIQVGQVELKPVLEVEWEPPKEFGKGANKINKIAIKYQHLMKPRRKFEIVERPVSDLKTQLFKNVESGEMYQVCASYITSNNAHGFWRCITTSVRDTNGKLNHYIEDEISIPDELPSPVVCEEANCKCEESPVIKGAMRVKWDPPKSPVENGEDEEVPEEVYTAATYIVHYTLNETDPNGEDFKTQVPHSQFSVDLPILLPNTTYRIMIEAQNEHGNGVDGTFFSCTTPIGAELPAPTRIEYYPINETAAMIEWEPLKLNKNSTIVDGYTLFWQQDGRAIQNRSIMGAEINSTILSNLTTESIYEVYLASRSAQTGISTRHSSKLVIKLPKDLNKKRRAPTPFHETKEFKATVLLSLLCATIVLCCCLGVICAYFRCQRSGSYKKIWSWCRNKRRPNIDETELQILPRLSLNARTSLTNANTEVAPSTGRTTLPSIPEIDMETESLIALKSPKLIDSKGGPSGFRPRGYRRYQQLVSDPDFLQQISELNQEPIIHPADKQDESAPHPHEEPEITSCPLPSKENHHGEGELGTPTKSPNSPDPKPSTSSPVFVHSIVTAEVHDEPTEEDNNLSSNETDFDPVLSDVPSISTSEHAQTSPRAISFEHLHNKPNGHGKGSNSSIEVFRSKSSSALNHFFDRDFCHGFRQPCQNPTSWQQQKLKDRQQEAVPCPTKHEVDSHSLFEQRKHGGHSSNHNGWHSTSNTTILPVAAPPATSLPNLTDSGIVFDDLHGTNGYGTTSSKVAANDGMDDIDEGSGKSTICHSDSRLIFVPSTMLSPSKPTAAESACTTFDLASLFSNQPKVKGHRRPNGCRLNSIGT